MAIIVHKHEADPYSWQICVCTYLWILEWGQIRKGLYCVLVCFIIWKFRLLFWHLSSIIWLIMHKCVYDMLHLVTQLCPALCNPMTIALQAPLFIGILQARILEWVAMPSSRESSKPMGHTQVSCITDRFLPSEPPGKPQTTGVGSLTLLQRNSWQRSLTEVSCIAGRFFTS